MSKIDSIEALRDFALRTLEDLAAGNIDTAQAGTSSKLCENVISTVKAEMTYCQMIGQEPDIKFMKAGKTRLLEGESQHKGLPSPKKY